MLKQTSLTSHSLLIFIINEHSHSDAREMH